MRLGIGELGSVHFARLPQVPWTKMKHGLASSVVIIFCDVLTIYNSSTLRWVLHQGNPEAARVVKAKGPAGSPLSSALLPRLPRILL